MRPPGLTKRRDTAHTNLALDQSQGSQEKGKNSQGGGGIHGVSCARFQRPHQHYTMRGMRVHIWRPMGP
jgi:hypothetical protein